MSSTVFPLLCFSLLILTVITRGARPSRPIGHALSWLPVFQAQAHRQTLPFTVSAINGSKEAPLSCSKVAGAPDGVVRCRRGGSPAPAPSGASPAPSTAGGHGASDSGHDGDHVIHAPGHSYILS